MSDSPRIRALCLLVALPVFLTGCGREGRLLTAPTPRDDLTAAAPILDPRDEPMLETMHGRRRQHLPPRAVIAEAKEGLGAVLTGEQVYLQKWMTFTDVPDTADFRDVLGVYLGDLLRRWDFSVSGASATGFLAKAQGRCGTDAAGITVTLSYQRGQPIVWSVQRRRPCRRRALGRLTRPASRDR